MGAAIIEDTRQQAGRHAVKHAAFEAAGIALIRSKLPFGDYAYPPTVSVDTKQSIAELYQNVTLEHDRFARECEAARTAGAMLVILTENTHGIANLADLAEWTEPERDFAKRKGAKRPISGARLAKACETMHGRYGVMFGFCAPEDAARKIIEILDWGCGDGVLGHMEDDSGR